MKNDIRAAIGRMEVEIENYRIAEKNTDLNQPYIRRCFQEDIRLFSTALAALRDALRRQDGCDVCNHDGFDEMVCYIPTENGDGLMVMSNYCPNCGCEISKQAIKYGAGYVDQDILRSAT